MWLIDEGRRWGFTTSTGLAFTHSSIVDAHFEACRDVYRDQLAAVGIQDGWHVLDAGCGSGDFLPWLCELVGPAGRVSAIDIASENAAIARERAHALRQCAVDVRQGSVLRLPYPVGSFDAVWCSNTVQYLSDHDLAAALAELRRVVRPGGVVAIKELDAHFMHARPGDPYLFTDFFRAAGDIPGYARQLLRSRDLYRDLKRAGLTAVRQRTLLVEHYAPLTAAAWSFYGPMCARLAQEAVRLGLSSEWELFADPEGEDHPLRDPDGHIAEGCVLAVGVVPGTSENGRQE
jgi:ubiquinone/menaquinone biosynthesis C-methylase UbiE